MSLLTKEKEGNKGGLGVAQTPGWTASREDPGWKVKRGGFPASQKCSVHYACASFLPAQSPALHRLEMGRKTLSPALPQPSALSPLLGPPAQPDRELSLAQPFSPAHLGHDLKGGRRLCTECTGGGDPECGATGIIVCLPLSYYLSEQLLLF